MVGLLPLLLQEVLGAGGLLSSSSVYTCRSFSNTVCDAVCVSRILKNWPERNVRTISVTDGEKVGSMGDLGVQVRQAAAAAALAQQYQHPGSSVS